MIINTKNILIIMKLFITTITIIILINEIKTNIEPNNNFIYINNEEQYININEYPRDSNENINNIEINNKYIYNQNKIPEKEIKEKDEQNNYIEIEEEKEINAAFK